MIRSSILWINGYGVVVAVVLLMLALIPALMIACGLTGGRNNTAVTQEDLSVETLRDQLAVATESEHAARKALEEAWSEAARLRADLQQAAKDLADKMQVGQEHEAILHRHLATLQLLTKPRPEMAADAKTAKDAASAATEQGQVAASPTPSAAVAPFDAAQARRHQEEWAKHLGIEVEIKNSKGQTFVLIPPGKFTMGEGDRTVEVTFGKPFFLGQTEVTNAQWMAVMGSVPSKWKDDGRPVESVDRKSVADFCYKLSEMSEEKKLGRVYRLPTEAEWEYACRAGTTSDYSFGGDESMLGEYGWYADNSGKKPLDVNVLLESLRDINSGEYDWGRYLSRLSDNNCQTHVVGQKKPNAWGLHDMHGNVWEWCSDWYGQYRSDLPTDPRGAYFASDRVVRGGSWYEGVRYCRSAYRYGRGPSHRNSTLGFRLALSLSGAQSPEARN